MNKLIKQCNTDTNSLLPRYYKDLYKKDNKCIIYFNRLLLIAKIVSLTRFFIFIYDYFNFYEIFDFIYRFSKEILKEFGAIFLYGFVFIIIVIINYHRKKNN